MGLFDTITKGRSGSPADISRMLQEKERVDAAKAQAEYREKLERIADTVHDILMAEDLTSDDVVNIFRLITNDIGIVAGKLKLSTLYGVPRKEADGSGEGGEEAREPSSDGASSEASEEEHRG